MLSIIGYTKQKCLTKLNGRTKWDTFPGKYSEDIRQDRAYQGNEDAAVRFRGRNCIWKSVLKLETALTGANL